MFVKYANVVEVARKAKIKIYHDGTRNCVQYHGVGKDKLPIFIINSATPNVKGIEKFVGIIHELSHVLFQSPFNATKKLLSDYWDLEGERYKLFFNVFNVLEDQRIESQMGKMYLKHADRFDKTTKKLGTLMKLDDINVMNPTDILLTIRFQRGNDIKNIENFSVYEKALNDVVLTDKFGALRVLVSIKPIIDKWVDDKENKEKWKVNDTTDTTKLKSYVDTRKTEKAFNENIIDQSGESDDDYLPDEIKDTSIIDDDEIEDMLVTNKINGESVVNDIFDSIRDDGKIKKLPKNLIMVKRNLENIEINKPISKGMSKIFRILMLKHKDFIDYYGDEIDVEAYVAGLIRGNNMGECRINKKNVHGVSVVVSIDGSSSMEGEKIDNARKMVATMFDSIKHLENIDMKANIWSGDNYGKVGMTEINNPKDVNKISIYVKGGGYYTTPIHMALEYSNTMLKHMKGSKKLLIIITDGIPNHFNGGYHIPMNSYIKTCKRSLLKVRSSTPNIMCIVIQPDYKFRYNPIRHLFKTNNIMNVETMNKASERVIKRFKQMVMKNLV